MVDFNVPFDKGLYLLLFTVQFINHFFFLLNSKFF